jgi:hypothetical protein
MGIFATIDWATLVSDATSTAVADFGTALPAVAAVTLTIAGAVLVYRRVKGLIR